MLMSHLTHQQVSGVDGGSTAVNMAAAPPTKASKADCFMGVSQWQSDHRQVPKEQLADKDGNKRKAAI